MRVFGSRGNLCPLQAKRVEGCRRDAEWEWDGQKEGEPLPVRMYGTGAEGGAHGGDGVGE